MFEKADSSNHTWTVHHLADLAASEKDALASAESFQALTLTKLVLSSLVPATFPGAELLLPAQTSPPTRTVRYLAEVIAPVSVKPERVLMEPFQALTLIKIVQSRLVAQLIQSRAIWPAGLGEGAKTATWIKT